jgi:hypothetical protein
VTYRAGKALSGPPASIAISYASRVDSSERPSPVVVSRLEELHAIIEYLVNEPVHVSDPTRPHVSAEPLEMLRFSDSLKRFTHYRFHEVQTAQGGLAVRVHPVMQVIAALIP